jgi:ATP-binding cassette, subfamily B, bacterial
MRSLLTTFWSASRRLCVAVLAAYATAAGSGTVVALLVARLLVDRAPATLTGLVVALVTQTAGFVAGAQFSTMLTTRWAAATQRAVTHRVWGQSLTDLESFHAGDLASRMERDLTQTADGLEGNVRALLVFGFTLVSVLAGLLTVSAWLAGLVVVTGAVAAVTITPTLRRLAPALNDESAAWARAAGIAEEVIWAEEDLRGVAAERYALRGAVAAGADQLRTGRAVWRLHRRVIGTAEGAGAVVVLGVLLLGALLHSSGRITLAGYLSLWTLSGAVLGALTWLAHVTLDLTQAWSGWLRLRELLQLPAEPAGGQPVRVTGRVRVDGVTFGYDDDEPVLRDLAFELEPGGSYAVLGRTGSGKSTLVKLLLGQVVPGKGSVSHNGVDLRRADLGSLRRQAGVIAQRADLYPGTLLDNVTLFDAGLEPRVAAAVTALGLDAWVDSLPDGLATRLGDGGTRLSAGQEQLVGFLRIMLRNCALVILDEATARMDPVTESLVVAATAALMRGRTTLVIAHRLASVARCHNVLVLDDGALVEFGPLAGSEHYAALLDLAEAGDDAADPAARHVVMTATPPAAETAEREPAVSLSRSAITLNRRDGRYRFGAWLTQVLADLSVPGGAITSVLWGRVVDAGRMDRALLAGLVAVVVLRLPAAIQGFIYSAEWWVRCYVRLAAAGVAARLTGPRRLAMSSGEALSQVTSLGTALDWLDSMTQLLAFGAMLVAATVLTGSWVPLAAAALLLSVPYLAGRLTDARLGRIGVAASAARDRLFAVFVGSLSAGRTVKLAGAEDGMLRRADELIAAHWATRRRYRLLRSLVSQLPNVAGLLLSIGLWAAYRRGAITAGVVLTAISGIEMGSYFGWLMATVVVDRAVVRERLAKLARLLGHADLTAPTPQADPVGASLVAAPARPVDVQPPERRFEPLRQLQLRRFSAVHETGQVAAAEVELTLASGTTTLLLGRIGSGKSSLLRAVAGLVASTGELRWNGRAVPDVAVLGRPPQLAYVAQLPRLLTGTIAGNVALDRTPDHHVHAALATAQLTSDLAGFQRGHETLVGYKGVTLSGGQVQRLALARALACQADLLVVDDVSSALDLPTELAVWRELRGSGATILGASYKRAALALADQVVVLDGGRVAAAGPWQVLRHDWSHLTS